MAGVSSSAVLELTTEMRKANSRCGKELSEVNLYLFKDETCEIWHKVELVLTGRVIWPGELWIFPIDGRASLDEEENPKM